MKPNKTIPIILSISLMIVSCTQQGRAARITPSVNILNQETTRTKDFVPGPSVTSTFGPTPHEQAAKLLSNYGWTMERKLATHELTLPDTLVHHAGDLPYAIYWAYNNELNQLIGMDMRPYLGKPITAEIYSLKEPLPVDFKPYEKVRAVIISHQGRIIGAWIDILGPGFGCALDQQTFGTIIHSWISDRSWKEWLLSSGVIDLKDPLDIEISQKTPEEIVMSYFEAINKQDYRSLYAVATRSWITRNLFSNREEAALYNLGYPVGFMNIKRAEIREIEFLEEYYEKPHFMVQVDYEFVDWRKDTTGGNGVHTRFITLVEEIPGFGWRVESDNTAP